MPPASASRTLPAARVLSRSAAACVARAAGAASARAVIVCAALSASPASWMFAVALFYWLWAVKNRVVGPLKKDLGVISFLIPLAAALVAMIFCDQTHDCIGASILGGIGCVLIAVQYGVVLVMLLGSYKGPDRFERVRPANIVAILIVVPHVLLF